MKKVSYEIWKKGCCDAWDFNLTLREARATKVEGGWYHKDKDFVIVKVTRERIKWPPPARRADGVRTLIRPEDNK